jgi:hypothetical protein
MDNLITYRHKISLLNNNWLILFVRKPGFAESDRHKSEQRHLLCCKAGSLSIMLQGIQADYTVITFRVLNLNAVSWNTAVSGENRIRSGKGVLQSDTSKK